jgi:hypothetical protein
MAVFIAVSAAVSTSVPTGFFEVVAIRVGTAESLQTNPMKIADFGSLKTLCGNFTFDCNDTNDTTWDFYHPHETSFY